MTHRLWAQSIDLHSIKKKKKKFPYVQKDKCFNLLLCRMVKRKNNFSFFLNKLPRRTLDKLGAIVFPGIIWEWWVQRGVVKRKKSNEGFGSSWGFQMAEGCLGGKR